MANNKAGKMNPMMPGNFAEAGIMGLRRRGGPLFEMFLAISIIAVVLMMVVPLRPWLLDLLISVNIAGSVLLISMALFIQNPLTFNAFPTLLLVATLYRLALNVSSTRLILLRADAGRIIDGFGGVVVGGDILVGAVVFGILAMVLFLVITKGAERVAEVAARFTLDALPGMQLAIDSDIRSGAVSSTEGAQRRAKLEQTSRYYGSLDGAMKFVRGDALAGLVIIGINIVGGLAIGMGRRGMSFTQALDTYTRLTIGDGLVTLIPALFISTAAGLLITRVGQGEDGKTLGQQLGVQMVAQPMALAAASISLLVLACVPGLPFWPFVLLGAGLGTYAVVRIRYSRRGRLLAGEMEGPIESAPSLVFVTIEVGPKFYRALSKGLPQGESWRSVMERVSKPLRQGLELPIGPVPILPHTSDRIPSDQAALKIRGVIQMPPLILSDPAAREPEAELGRFIGWASDELLAKAHLILGVDEVSRLVDNIAKQRPVLARETIPKILTLPALTMLLRALLRSRIGLEQLPEILEIVAKNPSTTEPDDLLRVVREGLSTSITQQLLGRGASIEAATLNAMVGPVLEDALVRSKDGVHLVLSSEVATQLIDACRDVFSEGVQGALIVSPLLRKPLADFLEDEVPRIAVVSSAELDASAKVRIVGDIAL